MKKLVNIIEKKMYVAMTLIAACGILTACSLDFSEWMISEEERGHGEPYTEETEYGNITYEFNDSVISITKNIEEYIVKVENDSILYFMDSTPEEWMPYVGCRLFAERSRKIFRGLNSIVLSVQNVGGMYKVVTTSTTISDVFKKLDYDLDFDLETPDLSRYDDETLKEMGYERRDSEIVDWNYADARDMDVNYEELRKERFENALKSLAKKNTISRGESEGDYDNEDNTEYKKSTLYDFSIYSGVVKSDDFMPVADILSALGGVGSVFLGAFNTAKDAFNGDYISAIGNFLSTCTTIGQDILFFSVDKQKLEDNYYHLAQSCTHYEEIHMHRRDKEYEEIWTEAYDSLHFAIEEGYKDKELFESLQTGDVRKYMKVFANFFLKKNVEEMSRYERKKLTEIIDAYNETLSREKQMKAEFSDQSFTVLSIPIKFFSVTLSRAFSSSYYKSWGCYSLEGDYITPTVRRGHKYSGYRKVTKEIESMDPDYPGSFTKEVEEYQKKKEINEVIKDGRIKFLHAVGNGGWDLKWAPTWTLTVAAGFKNLVGIGANFNYIVEQTSKGSIATKPGINAYAPYVTGSGRLGKYTEKVTVSPAVILVGHDIGSNLYDESKNKQIQLDNSIPFETSSNLNMFEGELMPSFSNKSTDIYTEKPNLVNSVYTVDVSKKEFFKELYNAKKLSFALRLYGNKGTKSKKERTDEYEYMELANKGTSITSVSLDDIKQALNFVSYKIDFSKDFKGGKTDDICVMPVLLRETKNGEKDVIDFDGYYEKWFEVNTNKEPSLEEKDIVQLESKKITDLATEPIRMVDGDASTLVSSGQANNLYRYFIVYSAQLRNFSQVKNFYFDVNLYYNNQKLLKNDRTLEMKNMYVESMPPTYTGSPDSPSLYPLTPEPISSYTYDNGTYTFVISFYLNKKIETSNFYLELKPYYYDSKVKRIDFGKSTLGLICEDYYYNNEVYDFYNLKDRTAYKMLNL